MAKETRLDENATLYQPRDERSEKEKFKTMSGKERWEHFKQYYLKSSILGLCLLILAGYFIYSVVRPKPEKVLDVAILDGVCDDPTCDQLTKDMNKILVHNPKKQQIIIDNSYYISNSDYGSVSQQKLVTYLMAKEIDVIIAPQDVFEEYCKNGFLSLMSDRLPTKLFSALSDNFYYSAGEVDDDDAPTGAATKKAAKKAEDSSEPAAYGIHLKGLSIKDSSGTTIVDPVIGIIVNSEYPENGTAFIQYLYDHGYFTEKDEAKPK